MRYIPGTQKTVAPEDVSIERAELVTEGNIWAVVPNRVSEFPLPGTLEVPPQYIILN